MDGQREVQEHALVVAVVRAFRRFEHGLITIGALESTLGGIANAMDGELPPEVRRAAQEANVSVETIRFARPPEEYKEAIVGVRRAFEDAIDALSNRS